MVRPRGLEPLTYGLAYHYSFHCLRKTLNLWSGLYLHHLRRDTYSLYGSLRFLSLFYHLTLIRSGMTLKYNPFGYNSLATGFLGIANVFT